MCSLENERSIAFYLQRIGRVTYDEKIHGSVCGIISLTGSRQLENIPFGLFLGIEKEPVMYRAKFGRSYASHDEATS